MVARYRAVLMCYRSTSNISNDMYERARKGHWHMLSQEAMQIPEIAIAVMSSDGFNLNHFPHFFENKDVVLAAAKQNGCSLSILHAHDPNHPLLKDHEVAAAASSSFSGSEKCVEFLHPSIAHMYRAPIRTYTWKRLRTNTRQYNALPLRALAAKTFFTDTLLFLSHYLHTQELSHHGDQHVVRAQLSSALGPFGPTPALLDSIVTYSIRHDEYEFPLNLLLRTCHVHPSAHPDGVEMGIYKLRMQYECRAAENVPSLYNLLVLAHAGDAASTRAFLAEAVNHFGSDSDILQEWLQMLPAFFMKEVKE